MWTCTHPLPWKPAHAFRRRLTHSNKQTSRQTKARYIPQRQPKADWPRRVTKRLQLVYYYCSYSYCYYYYCFYYCYCFSLLYKYIYIYIYRNGQWRFGRLIKTAFKAYPLQNPGEPWPVAPKSNLGPGQGLLDSRPKYQPSAGSPTARPRGKKQPTPKFVHPCTI